MPTIPHNFRCNCSHGTHHVPKYFKDRLALDDRLIKNFSDWGTWHLMEDIPRHQKIRPFYGRLAGDPNRPDDPADPRFKDLFRETDFGGNRVWKEGQELTAQERAQCLKQSYYPYYQNTFNHLKSFVGEKDPVVWMDLHCTSNYLLGQTYDEDRDRTEFTMPEFEFNADPELLDLEFLEAMQRAFEKKFGVKPKLNGVFKGGFVTRKCQTIIHTREQLRPILTAEEIRLLPDFHFIQLEVNRDLYMNTRTQQLNKKEARHLGRGIVECFAEVAEAYQQNSKTAIQ